VLLQGCEAVNRVSKPRYTLGVQEVWEDHLPSSPHTQASLQQLPPSALRTVWPSSNEVLMPNKLPVVLDEHTFTPEELQALLNIFMEVADACDSDGRVHRRIRKCYNEELPVLMDLYTELQGDF
jgi:hypothetical protein